MIQCNLYKLFYVDVIIMYRFTENTCKEDLLEAQQQLTNVQQSLAEAIQELDQCEQDEGR